MNWVMEDKFMVTIKKFVSIVLGICILINIIPMNNHAAAAYNSGTTTWNIKIESISLHDELYTEETVINYDGSTQILKHRNTPSNGMVYAIATVNAEKNDILADSLNASNFKLVTPTAEYSRLQDDSFLAYHNYSVFSTATEVNISSRGSLCFEVPEEYIENSTLGWIITNGEISSIPYQGESSEVPVEPNIVEQQSEIEEYLIATYENNGKASLNNPFIQLDPYGVAPLSALVMFETDTVSDITVTVHGKNGASDFTYTLSNTTTHHEIPVIGLYPDFDNTVTLTTGDESNSIKIQTSSLPSDMEQPVISKASENAVLNNGFVFMSGNYRMLVDSAGEVRWYSTITTGYDPSGVDLVSGKDGIWFSVNPYSAGAAIYHLSWLGKINHNISYVSSAHHDITKVTDDEYLYWGGNQLLKINLSTQEINLFFDPASVLDSSIDSLEIRQERIGDWLHPNTVSYECFILGKHTARNDVAGISPPRREFQKW